jgi:hypothetical protein
LIFNSSAPANADFSISTNQQPQPQQEGMPSATSTAGALYSQLAACSNDAQCLNGGTCTPTSASSLSNSSSSNNSSNTSGGGGGGRTCACPPGYGGAHCQDHCPLKCQNGGYCQVADARDPARYGGGAGSTSSSSSSSSSSNLEARYDASYYRSGGGTSGGGTNSYQCRCRGLYSGKLCNVPYQNCPENRKCYNGGSCLPTSVATTSSTYCTCPDGFGGPSCDQRGEGFQASEGASTSDDPHRAGRTAGIVVAVLAGVVVLVFSVAVAVRRRRRLQQQRQQQRKPYQFVLSKNGTSTTSGANNLRPHPESYWESEEMPRSPRSMLPRMPFSSMAAGRDDRGDDDDDDDDAAAASANGPDNETDPLRLSNPHSSGNDNADDEGEAAAGMADDNPEAKHRWRNIV